jgi:hypothetical protein
MPNGHWSDCAVHNAPALPLGECDCGGLDLTHDPHHGLVASPITGARRLGILIEQSDGLGRLTPA